MSTRIVGAGTLALVVALPLAPGLRDAVGVYPHRRQAVTPRAPTARALPAPPTPSAQPAAARLTPIIADLGVHGATNVARAADGRVYFTREDGVYGYDAARRAPFRVFTGAASDVAISPRGDQLAFATGEDMAVWTMRLDPSTGRAAAGTPRRLGLRGGRAPAFSPDGRFVAYSALPASDTAVTPRLVLVPAAGGPERVLVSEPGFAQSLRWSPDGRWIYYWHGQPTPQGPRRTIRRVRREGGEPEVLAPAEQLVGLSPDGAHVAYGITRPRLSTSVEKTVVVADTAGREVGRVLLPRDAIPVGWGPGPRQLLVRRVQPTSGIHFVDLHGRIRELSPVTGADEWPSLSADGRQLRLQTAGAHPQLVLAELATGRRRVLYVAPRAGTFMWMADDRVLFLAQDGSEVSVVQVDDGSALARTRRVPGCSAALPVLHTDDGRRVLCVTRRDSTHELHAYSLDDLRDTPLGTIAYPETERPRLALAGRELLVLAASGQVRILPVAGGPSRTLYVVGQDEALFENVMGVSRDGEWVGFLVSVGADAPRQPARVELRIVPLSGGAVRSLPIPAIRLLRYLGWDPAGRYVLLFGERDGRYDVWLVPLSGEPPYMLTAAETYGVDMLQIARDGSGVLYTAAREGASLWAADLTPILGPGRAPAVARPP